MRNRLGMLTAAGVFLAVTYTAAAPNVTFVMTSGQRVSGLLVYHHGVEMSLNVNGREQNFRYEDIAVVEFAQGMPTAAELDRLPGTNRPAELMRDMIAFRDGRTVHGKLHDIVDDAETISFDVGPGDRQRYASRDIARMYFNGGAARDVYRNVGAMGAGRQQGALSNAAQRAGQNATQAQQQQMSGTTFEIRANQEWTKTGINVRQGQVVRFQASGEIKLNREGYMVATPGGISPASYDQNAPIKQALVGMLIGRVGTRQLIAIGTTQSVTMPANGELELGINDSNVKDNSGFFTVIINTTGRQ